MQSIFNIRRKLLLLIVLISAFLLLAPATPPDSSVSIEEVLVYRHVIDLNDVLVVIRYDIPYDTEPTERAEELYNLVVVDGVDIIVGGEPQYYNRDIGAIYIEAPNTFEWERSYEVKVEGDPLLFSSPIPVFSLTLDSDNYISTSSVTTTRTRLVVDIGNHALALERIHSTTTSTEDYLTSDIGKNFTLDGESHFLQAIPRLKEMVPELFRSISIPVVVEKITFNRTYESTLLDTLSGSDLDDLMLDLADVFTVSKGTISMVIILILFFAIVMITFSVLRKIELSIIFALPVFLLGALFGMVSLGILFAAMTLLVVGMVYLLVLKGANP